MLRKTVTVIVSQPFKRNHCVSGRLKGGAQQQQQKILCFIYCLQEALFSQT